MYLIYCKYLFNQIFIAIDYKFSNKQHINKSLIVIYIHTNYITHKIQNTRCAVLHVQTPQTWKLVMDAWLENAHFNFIVPKLVVRTWSDILYDMVPNLIEFLTKMRQQSKCGYLLFEQVWISCVRIYIWIVLKENLF